MALNWGDLKNDPFKNLLAYTVRFMQEVGREFPAAPWLMGRSLVDIQVGGLVLPAGNSVSTFSWLLNQDPRIFPDPHTFDPDRWLNPLAIWKKLGDMQFGGQRHCLGKDIAQWELVLAYAMIVQRYILSPVNPGIPRRVFGTTVAVDESQGMHILHLQRRIKRAA
jgi:cytochrome P450